MSVAITFIYYKLASLDNLRETILMASWSQDWFVFNLILILKILLSDRQTGCCKAKVVVKFNEQRIWFSVFTTRVARCLADKRLRYRLF